MIRMPVRSLLLVDSSNSATIFESGKLRRTVSQRATTAALEAAKQCGRNRLMEIAPPRSWQEFVATAPSDCTRWVAHPASAVNTTSAATVSQSDIHQLPAKPATIEIWLAIGPEGGLTDEEIQQALASGWHAVDLGPRILRVETAALALAAYCLLGSG